MGASSLGIFVRLACVKHAASVRPEPGSNSLYKFIVRFVFWLHFVTLTIFRFRFLSKPPSLLCKVLISKSFDFEPTLSSFSRYCLIFKDHRRISDFSIISHRFPFVKYFFRFFQNLFTRFTFPPWQLYHYITFSPLCQAFFRIFFLFVPFYLISAPVFPLLPLFCTKLQKWDTAKTSQYLIRALFT